MEKYKNYIAGIVGIIAIVAGVSYFERAPQIEVNIPERTVGSVVGPESFFDEYNDNGVKTYPRRIKMSTATNTICALQSPAASTTFSVLPRAIFLTSSTSATYVVIATSTTGFTTSTPLTIAAVGANAQAQIIATSTDGHSMGAPVANGTTSGSRDNVIPPLTWVVWEMGRQGLGNTQIALGNVSPTGFCEVEFLAF